MQQKNNRRNRSITQKFSFSKSFDNGEILKQKPVNRNYPEYVVQRSVTDIPFEEYIVYKEPPSNNESKNPGYNTASKENGSTGTSKEKAPLTDEQKLEVLDNLQAPANMATPSEPKKEAPAFQSSFNYPQQERHVSKAESEEDTFVKDMEAILKGNKAYNSETKSVENKPQKGSTPAQAPPKPTSLDQLTNEHSIFDQIAKSMEYAKAYDLGSISLAQKFEDFDKLEDQKNLPVKKATSPLPDRFVKTKTYDEPGHEEFLKDLSTISKLNASKEVSKYPFSQEKMATNEPGRYLYQTESLVTSQSAPNYSYAQNPAVIAGIAVADAIQIGLGATAIVQSQVANTQGGFSLSYDKAQRLLTNEARAQMPGAQKTKLSYSRELFWIGELKRGFADASVIIEWEGNPYGEIGTAIIRRDIQHSTEWTKSSANTTITKVDRIPLPGTDPRAWPLVYIYEGTFDPVGNGYFEFSGEFEINAFGGLKFIRHEVVNRSAIEFLKMGEPEEYVKKGLDNVVPVPEIPKEQIDYLRSKLP